MSQTLKSCPVSLKHLREECTDLDCGRKQCREAGCCSMTSLPVPFSLKCLERGLEMIFSHDDVDTGLVQEYMTMYRSKTRDWGKYAIFDDHKYTRNLVATGNGKYNLIVLCWNYSQGSTIHSHGGSHCFMKVLQGTAQEEQFTMPTESNGEECMIYTDTIQHTLNQVGYIADSQCKVHRVSNPSHVDQLVTLHLYSPAYVTCNVYDEHTSHVGTAKMTFWSKNGKIIDQ